MNLQEYPRASINRNSSTVHPSAYFNHHQRVPPALDMQVHPYNQHAQVASPSYGMPPSNHNQHMDSTSRSSGPFRSVAAAAEFFIYPEASCFGVNHLFLVLIYLSPFKLLVKNSISI